MPVTAEGRASPVSTPGRKPLKDAKQRLLAELATVDDPRARRVEELLRSDQARPRRPGRTAPRRGRRHRRHRRPPRRRRHRGSRPTRSRRPANGSGTPTAARGGGHDRRDLRRRVAALLQAALDHHSVHGDEPCPVCRTGTLDAAWQAATTTEIARLNRDAADLRAARAARAGRRRGSADGSSPPCPRSCGARFPVDTDAVRRAWSAWEDARGAAPDELPEALRVAHADLATAVDAVQTAAKQALVRLDETWRPVSSRLWAWHEDATAALQEAATVTHLRKADSWLRAAAGELSDERMRPFAARSQEIWRQLRQESDVDLGGITLTGSGNQRKVLLDVTVDGRDTAALSVMSQGELHALGLSLFLPRATRDESPFRFVLIDDPVQAMDPAKVDGLARVLSEIAKDRQVIVFSHDDRLADAVRRLPDAAHVYEVQRGARSQVQVVPNHDPISRYLSDARAVINDSDMPDDLRREIVANCCRGALEAAAHAKVRRVRLGRGDAHADVDRALAAARTTHDKVTLAMFDDPARHRALLPHLARIGAVGGGHLAGLQARRPRRARRRPPHARPPHPRSRGSGAAMNSSGPPRPGREAARRWRARRGVASVRGLDDPPRRRTRDRRLSGAVAVPRCSPATGGRSCSRSASYSTARSSIASPRCGRRSAAPPITTTTNSLPPQPSCGAGCERHAGSAPTSPP